MRIAMLTTGHVVTDARVVHKQAASLAKAGHTVVVFGLEGKPPVDVPGVDQRVLAKPGGGLPARARLMPRLYHEAVAWRPDVVTCHEPESAVVGLFVKWRLGVPVLFDIHELYHETLSSRLGRWGPLVRRLTRILLRTEARRCDWLTVVSPASRDFYRAVRYDGRVDMIQNSPIMKFFPLCDQSVAGPLTVAHEGNLGLNRGMVQILEALAIARRQADLKLLIVGRILPREQDIFDQTVRRLDLGEALVFPGWVAYDQIGLHLARAQIGIVCMQPTPNNFLSLSNKIYNYMACGLASIVPAGSASADLVAAHDAGLAVDTTNPQEVAEAFVRLAADADLRRRLGANGRRALETELGWHKMEERLYEIYQELAAGGSA